jgi:hypothetical protein
MRADNEFLMALVGKLTEIMQNTADMETARELSEFIDVINESL